MLLMMIVEDGGVAYAHRNISGVADDTLAAGLRKFAAMLIE